MREKVPIQVFVMVPFPPLPNLSAHEEQLLPGLSVHISEKQSEVGKLLPQVARHLAQQRAFAVNNLIMRKRHYKVLSESIEHAESQLVVVILPVYGVLGYVQQSVMHPAHVPFGAESQAPYISGTGAHRPGSGLLGKCLHIGIIPVDFFIETAQKLNCINVLLAAIFIGYPFSCL